MPYDLPEKYPNTEIPLASLQVQIEMKVRSVTLDPSQTITARGSIALPAHHITITKALTYDTIRILNRIHPISTTVS